MMLLELKAPHSVDFRALLLWPVFMSYVLSFIYVGIYWKKHQCGYHPSRTLNDQPVKPPIPDAFEASFYRNRSGTCSHIWVECSRFFCRWPGASLTFKRAHLAEHIFSKPGSST